MLDNIRNLIRHGRQAIDGNAVHVATITENRTHPTKSKIASTATNAATKISSVLPTSGKNVKCDKTCAQHDLHEHHAEDLKPVAENLVQEETMKENQRVKQNLKSIEKYHMGEVLGEGAFSVVYSAIDKSTGENVAIKVIKKYQLDEKQRDSVIKEVTLMNQLSHPNIVKLIDFVESDDYYYIIQEIVEGGELFNQIVKYTYFSEDLSRHVIIQVAEALLYMHEQVGIVHRDLKPENIFFKPIKVYKEDSQTRQSKLRRSDNPKTKLDEGKFIMNYGGGGIGLIKIGDFGLSKQISLNHKNALKTPCGTIGYTAPEIVRDQRYSKEVDMWALGCVLYILLCGFPPFFNDSIEELTRTVAKGEFKFLSPWWDEISDGAKYCVSKLLTVNPGERYTVEDFLRDPWILDFLQRSEKFQQQQQKKKDVPSTSSDSKTDDSVVQQTERRGSGMPGFEVPTEKFGKLTYSDSLNNVHVKLETVNNSDESSFEDEDSVSSDFGESLHRINHTEGSLPEPIGVLERTFEPGPAQSDYRDQDGDSRIATHHVVDSNRKRKMAKTAPQFTPEIKAMKDIFDMSIAAHRMHEENEFNVGETLLEEAEDEDQIEEEFANEVVNPTKVADNFHLNMGAASILARRKNKAVF
ncbi:hypothetical protein CANINC_002123 [Pichia inconspicua]|uniref:Protein kinase domain-containing protein n=1 Tax=Pichia inconspicua TaxID=52247 RepID=A0A4T0X2E9_9ASCO|nr:hypothetical protein CANINC_002123 [[Candida] inconspicua]